ncbi:glutathione-disulfide reductase GRX7 KNAG_0J01260 [Huiozyma naganishii CBS 8797]|uniref:Glutaredoxin domain-containing protein n=1 Tax=Huiozyma naganishii (strain ATCC MYA-139 / BCRC 22969 / CBS 8797 / KCTC 17520 / NBRC 10181 / NCYC 3082 / Yp74L-3) TaxID=1071383 RepID=J7S2S1_HUIN7|nr:hypothetical protein KNAG_0J01260 [Kazachstania naganishii CBS 8797]CCK72207.1 hypothetical protein KNAG_0J01260 [Kazachstania naganishii CBS 8797]
MAITLNKRNIRALSVTLLLLLLVLFVTQNARNVSVTVDDRQVLEGVPLVNYANVEDPVSVAAVKPKIGTDRSGQAPEPAGVFSPAVEYDSILSRSPVVIFSKSYCPYSAKLKKLLAAGFKFTPAYTVVELDEHEHGPELQKYIAEKTGRSTVPNLIVNGVSHGGCDDIVALSENGKLLDRLNEWGGSAVNVIQV